MSNLAASSIIHGSIKTGKKTINGNSSSNITPRIAPPTAQIGTKDYEELENKPQIESVELIGNKTFEDLGLESLNNEDLMHLLTF